MAINIVILSGRPTKDPEIRYSKGDKPICVASFTLAVDRFFKGERSVDYIRCTAFGKTAEILEKYVTKGKQITIIGDIRTNDYEKDGRKTYMTEVCAKSIELGGSKNDTKTEETEDQIPAGFTHLDDDIPF